jgi:hypothetical protein
MTPASVAPIRTEVSGHARYAAKSEELNERPEPEREEQRQQDQLQHAAEQIQQIQPHRSPSDPQRDPHYIPG